VKIRWLIIQIKSLLKLFIIGHDKSESPSLTYEESNRLYQSAERLWRRNQIQAIKKVKANEYFNGLQVKFSYAITCHKSRRSGIPYSSNNLICLTELTEITSDGCIPRWPRINYIWSVLKMRVLWSNFINY
jgi:hypothetical protein